MLVITFGRAASQELRERVREQLVEAERALADPERRARPADWSACSPTSTTPTIAAAAQAAARRPGRLRRARRSRPPTSSASWCCARSASPATPTPAPSSWTASTTWSSRWSTTSTSAASAQLAEAPPFKRAVALQLARAAVGDPQAELAPADAEPGSAGPSARSTSPSGARRGRPAQAPPRRPVVRRPAEPARRRPRGRRRPGPRADAPALEDRAGRRVPGHRPGAVEGARPGLHRPRDDGADRRPEAGDLRLPRAATSSPTSRRPTPPRPGGRWRPTGAATRRWSTRCRRCSAAPTLGDPRIAVHPRRRRTTRAAGWPGAPAPHPLRVRLLRARTSPPADDGTVPIDAAPRPHRRRTSPTTSRGCSPRAPPSRAGRSRPATSPS